MTQWKTKKSVKKYTPLNTVSINANVVHLELEYLQQRNFECELHCLLGSYIPFTGSTEMGSTLHVQLSSTASATTSNRLLPFTLAEWYDLPKTQFHA